MAISLDKFVFR